MRRLILLRHAKSSWADPDQHDAARPLNDRGRRVAVLIGAYLADEGLVPDLALLSTARRVIETWDLAERGMDQRTARASAPIYMAPPEDLLTILRGAPDDAATVLMLGHEPSIAEFAHRLTGPEIAEGAARAFERFPTGALAELQWDDLPSWSAVGFGAARLARFVPPKVLV
jgi:phosphohistidine phosphatase